MRIAKLFETSLAFSLLASGEAQSLDTAQLDQFCDCLAKKDEALGSLTVAKHGKVLYTHALTTTINRLMSFALICS